MDLIVVGEWMPIRVFKNNKGALEETDLAGLGKSEGWWCSIFPADVDGDGDMDYFVGNAGANLQFKASVDEPIQLDAYDLNNDGTIDPILSYYIKGKSYPLATRDELLDQVAPLRKKFTRYADYANATIVDIASKEQLQKMYRFNAFVLQSCWLENLDGKDFKLKILPPLAQFSAINAFVFEDLDHDGKREILAAGNFFPFKPQLGRSDASMGLTLDYIDGNVHADEDFASRLGLTGDIRDMVVVRTKDGKKRLVVSRNNDNASIFSFVNDPATKKRAVNSAFSKKFKR